MVYLLNSGRITGKINARSTWLLTALKPVFSCKYISLLAKEIVMMQNHGNLAMSLLKNIEIVTMEVVKRWD